MEREKNERGKPALPVSIFISAIIIAGAWIYTSSVGPKQGLEVSQAGTPATNFREQASSFEAEVLPREGVVLPVVWGDLGVKLTSVGAIDGERFQSHYKQRGEFSDEYDSLLNDTSNGKLKITGENAGYILNLLWALGLANKNPILDFGEMKNPAYGGAQNFASTAGWIMARGSPMDHYSRHKFFDLTAEEQALVEKVSRGIYRPCCGNSAHFPDCNHGLAMLGLLELLASQGLSEQEMWKAALAVNSYWFPNTYLTIATYMKNKGVEWQDVNPQEILGINYSSAQGYGRIASQVSAPGGARGGNSCGIDGGGAAAAPPRPPNDCGI